MTTVVPVSLYVLVVMTVFRDVRGTMSLHPSSQSVKVPCGKDSFAVFDLCGVCGGDGTSCRGQRGQGQGQDEGSRSRGSRGSRFMWRLGPWTPCSVTCGVGHRRRTVSCMDVDSNDTVREEACRGLEPKPRMEKRCVRPPCPTRELSRASRSSGGELVRTPLQQLFSDQVPSMPEFVTGQWRACSVTCGPGARSRDVTCTRLNTFTRQQESLADWECLGRKPEMFKACHAGACPSDLPSNVNAVERVLKTVRWHVGDYSSCSRSCLGGMQESQVTCVEVVGEGEGEEGGMEEVSPARCAGIRKPPVMVRSCNAIPCPPRWIVGDYSHCSKQCGGGVMRRSVRCVQEEADDSLTPVDEYRCPDPRPVSEMPCNSDYCPAQWSADTWGECSQTCGIGTQTRRVSCVTEPVSDRWVTVSDAQCPGPRPHPSRSCSLRDCPENKAAPPVIKADNYTYIQLRRSRRVKLTVGGRVVVLPGQSFTIRCPVKNFHRRLIFWSKRFKLVPMSGRVRATFYGNLKIRKANPVSDAGTYTCMAGPESADVTIDFLTRKEAMKKLRDIRHYLTNHSSWAAMILKPGGSRQSPEEGAFQDGGHSNLTSHFLYMADQWSPCSVTCGSGQQRRKVTCTRVTRKYMKLLPERECEKLGLEKPEDVKKCSPLSECPRWMPGKWSACSLKTCVRNGYAERRRKLHCAYSNGTSVSSQFCWQERRPETARLCVNEDCIPHWTTSRWSKCMPRCGPQGLKMRMLTCSWRKTGTPAWDSCRGQPRPVVRKVCKLRPCPLGRHADCHDSSRYCTLARMLKMCRYNDFRRKCCKSCTDFLQSTLS